MFDRTKQSWRRFAESRPGHRFQDRYRRQSGRSGFDPVRLLYIVGGALIVVASLLTAPLPGPGMGTAALGLALIAGEFLPGARALDWLEVELRRLARWADGLRKRSPALAALLALAVLLTLAALAYGAYHLLFGG